MTTENKNKVDLYIFDTDENGKDKIVGSIFKHNKGNGLNILIGNKRYKAFPPKTKQSETETGEGA